jgi:hypothetical protein
VRKKTYKYGIEVPTSLVRAKELDRINCNTHWIDALKLEIHNAEVAFEVLEDGKSAPQGWTKASGHIVWDLKMDFARKPRWVLDGRKLPTRQGSTYAGVVSRESVRKALTCTALIGLKVRAADIRHAYLQAPSSCKDYIICGPEFGVENEGKVALFHRTLSGGKSAGRDFRNHLRSCMHHIGCKSCPAHPGVWMRSAIKSDGTEVYEYVLLYADDTLSIGVEAESVLRKEIGKYFELKEKSIGPPKLYLGGHLSLVELDNGVKAWALSSSQYVRAAVQNVEDCIAKDETKRWKLSNKAETPLCTSYRPELDVTSEFSPPRSCLLPIPYWNTEMDCGAGETRHLSCGFHHIIPPGFAKGGTTGASFSHLHTPQEVSQH